MLLIGQKKKMIQATDVRVKVRPQLLVLFTKVWARRYYEVELFPLIPCIHRLGL